MATAPLAANKSGAFVLVLKAVHNAAMFEYFGWHLEAPASNSFRCKGSNAGWCSLSAAKRLDGPA